MAGAALGHLTRVRARSTRRACGSNTAPKPWSAGLAVPVFALFAAGVPIDGSALAAMFTDRVGLAVVAGLVIGKFVGITGAALLAVRLRVAVLPPGVGTRDLVAVAMLGGVGFTVSLLIAELALPPAEAELARRP